eukprot:4720322-Karenia_brevis.AAC.1
MGELLGDIYVIIRVLTDPTTEGWASMRPRQVLVMILKVWAYNVIRNSNEQTHVPCSRVALVRNMALPQTISFLADRTCAFTWKAYIRAAASSDELNAEIRWAASRKSIGEYKLKTSRGSVCLDALTRSEFKRWKSYQELYPG